MSTASLAVFSLTVTMLLPFITRLLGRSAMRPAGPRCAIRGRPGWREAGHRDRVRPLPGDPATCRAGTPRVADAQATVDREVGGARADRRPCCCLLVVECCWVVECRMPGRQTFRCVGLRLVPRGRCRPANTSGPIDGGGLNTHPAEGAA